MERGLDIGGRLSSCLKVKQSSKKAGSMLRPVADNTVDARVKKRQTVSNEQE